MTDDIAKTLAAWWRAALRPAEDSSSASALRARLRRADHALDVLAQPQVHDLVAQAPWLRHRPDALACTVQVLAQIERNDPRSLARVLGAGDTPAMSRARFERLIRSEAGDLPRALRRAVAMTDKACQVGALGRDILNWDGDRGDDIKRNWYFDYFNAARSAPEPTCEDISQ